MRVLKDGKEDKGGNAYFQQQMPEDFADHLISLQNAKEKALEKVVNLCEMGLNPSHIAQSVQGMIEGDEDDEDFDDDDELD